MKLLIYVLCVSYIHSLQLKDVSSIGATDTINKMMMNLMNKTKKEKLNRMNLFDQYIIDNNKQNKELKSEKDKLNSYFKEKSNDNIIALQNKINEIKKLVAKSNKQTNNNDSLAQITIEKNKRTNVLNEKESSKKALNGYEHKFDYYVNKLNTISKLE